MTEADPGIHSSVTTTHHQIVVRMTDNTNEEERSGKNGSPAAAPAASRDPVEEVTDLTWERMVERSALPVAVMFSSPACAFCRQMEPAFRQYAAEYRGSVLFVKLNVLSSQWTAERYGVRSTPTFKFFCSGKAVQDLVGAVYPALLKRMVEEVLVHGKECARNSTVINYDITGYG